MVNYQRILFFKSSFAMMMFRQRCSFNWLSFHNSIKLVSIGSGGDGCRSVNNVRFMWSMPDHKPQIGLLSPIPMSICHQQIRYKSKDKKKDRQSDRPKVILDPEDMNQVYHFDEFKSEIDTMIEQFKNDLKLNYNIKMNPRVIESLEISYDGVNVTLGDICNVVRKQNDLIINLSATPSAVKSTMKAINESGLNLTVQNDGHIVYVKMPRVTTEHRQALIKSVKQFANEMKDRLKDRNLHKRFLVDKDPKKISQDLLHDANANLLFLVKQKCSEVDDIVKQKIDSMEQ